MNLVKEIRPFGRSVFFLGALMMIYGFLARIIGLYFFWESSYIGWGVLLIGLIFWLLNRRKYKKRNNKKSIGEGIGIAFSIIFLLALIISYVFIHQMDAYAAGKDYLLKNDSLSREVGGVNGISLIPSAAGSSSGSDESATLDFILKGNKKYEDLVLELHKADSTGWKVIAIQ